MEMKEMKNTETAQSTEEVFDWDDEIQKMPETGICCICGKPYGMFGNNPEPLCDDKDYTSRCCNDCDRKYVLTARIIKDFFEENGSKTGDLFPTIAKLLSQSLRNLNKAGD